MAKSLDEFISERFGIQTRGNINPVVSQVGTAAVVVARANPARYALVMVNLSANVMFALPGSIPVSTRGIRLDANGGALSVAPEDDFILPALEWQVIAGDAASDLLVLEVLAEA